MQAGVKVSVFCQDGRPIKPFYTPKANSVCKRCGAAIRWAKDKTVGVRMPVDEDVYIVQPVSGFGIGYRKYITRGGDIISGEPMARGSKGCRVCYRVHKCGESSRESRAEVRLYKD